MKHRPNQKALDALYHSHDASFILNELASMARQDETILDGLETRLTEKDISRRGIVYLFKKLQEYGAGELIVGRKGHPSRFKWTVDSIGIHPIQDDIPVPKAQNQSTLLAHTYPLRPGLVTTFELPSDITTIEARRLSQFIQSLPFAAEIM